MLGGIKTMTLTRYNPFTNDDFSTPLRLFNDSVNRIFSDAATTRPWTPSVDIKESADEIVLRADLPGVDEKDIDIKVEDGTLTLKGERKFEHEKEGEGYHRIERSYGSFVRCFALPESVSPEKVQANYKHGVLTVTLPKKEVAKPRSIKVAVSD
jgi:HSP20 family protein